MSDPRKRTLRLLTGALWACVAVVAFSAWRLAAARPPSFHGTTYDTVARAADFNLVDHTGRPATLASFRGQAVLLFFGYTHCPDICPLTITRLSSVLGEMGERADGVRVVLVTVDPARDTPPVLAEYVRRFGPRVTGLTGDSASVAAAMSRYGAYILPADVARASGGHGAHAGHASSESSGSRSTGSTDEDRSTAPAGSTDADGSAGSTDSEGADRSAGSSRSTESAGSKAKAAVIGHSGVIYGIDREGNLRVVIPQAAAPDELADDVRALARL